MSSNEKGQELEAAVHAIESVILGSAPFLQEQSFTIESRKIVEVDGVRHEIDIYVTVDPASGYGSTFLFECKNWKDAVNKNEVIIFSEKIKALSAQRGFFVARSYTRDAEAQALKDPRMKLLQATEHDAASTIAPDGFHITAPDMHPKCSILFRAAGSTGKTLTPIDTQTATARIIGEDLSLNDYLNTWMEMIYQQRLLTFSTGHLAEGTYPMTGTGERVFGRGEFTLDGRDMEYVRMECEFGVRILRPSVVSHYEVSTRGRVIRLAKAKVREDLTIQMMFVQANTQ